MDIALMNSKIFLTLIAFCLLVAPNPAPAQEMAYGMIKGTILTEDNAPLSDAQVCFYNVNSGPPPFRGEYWRLCQYVSQTGEDGSFAERLQTGEYYIMATRKASGERPGPPVEAGDMTWPAFDGRESQTYLITEEGPTDIGIIPGAVPFKAEWLPKGTTAIEGRVLLQDSTPAEGVLVLASGDPKVRDLVFVSDKRTGTDGKYIVRVAEDGVYYINAKGSEKPIEKAVVHLGKTTKGIDIRVKENPGRRWDKPRKDK
ncbi:MAG: carboxypeptidase regulatory-like domain-containing protein [Nitrospiraceae bacterium]|nr:MAG: carboxypeptidase regulatory-like domain-containing protein [Nitrospiraceae bacterium]